MALTAYLATLKNHRGIKDVRISAPRPREQEHDIDLSVRTQAGTFILHAVEYKSHLSHGVIDHLVARFRRRTEPIMVFAPHIGTRIGTRLAEAGINYVDRHGNCHLAVGSLYLHVEGRTGPPQPSSDKGLRSAGYQVLFAYLAEHDLLDQPVRVVAERAGVSRQPPSDVRRRLVEDAYVVETKSGLRWLDRRREDALNLWLRGYETTVRGSLLWGTYRTRSDPDKLESDIATICAPDDFRWGGTAAAYRLVKHYRGSRTTVHVREPLDPAELGAVLDPRGNLVVMNAFGAINWESGRTVHPLLVYSELLREGDERAREAAEVLFDEHIRPKWGRAP